MFEIITFLLDWDASDLVDNSESLLNLFYKSITDKDLRYLCPVLLLEFCENFWKLDIDMINKNNLRLLKKCIMSGFWL